jgi:hypothetical protein
MNEEESEKERWNKMTDCIITLDEDIGYFDTTYYYPAVIKDMGSKYIILC